VSLADVAYELYGVLPSEFIAARTAAAKADKSLAAEIKALRKPSAAAWAVNLLVRSKPDLVDQVLSLGVQLRQAQAGLQGDQLRALAHQRRQLVAAVVKEVRTLAADAGLKVTEPVARQVEDTLTAAMVDEAAAAAVHTGMLTESLESTGIGSLAVGSVVGVVPGRLRSVPAVEPSDDDRLEEAQTALERASSLLTDAEARLAKAAKKKAKRDAAVLQLQGELEELRRRIAQVEHDLEQAEESADKAADDHARAEGLRDDAKQSASEAAKALAKLKR
jgi:hypothetical protein